MSHKLSAAFDQGQVPTISLINKATTDLTVDLPNLRDALQKYVDDIFSPVWHVKCTLEITDKFQQGHWAIVFADDTDAFGALGYHDLTPDGLPLSKVFVQTVKKYKESVSVTACHELAEMLVDPGIQLGAQAPNGWWYAYEVCDAVQGFTFEVDGVEMSDFMYPSYFEGFRKPRSTKFSYLDKIKKPFQIAVGGYMPVWRRGRWDAVFGDKETAKKHKFGKAGLPRLAARNKYIKVHGKRSGFDLSTDT